MTIASPRALVIAATSYSPIAVRIAIKIVKTAAGAHSTTPISSGNATAAVQSLVRNTQSVARAAIYRAEAPLTRLIGRQRFEKIALAEIRPQRVCEI